MTGDDPITRAEKRDCALREVRMRLQVYPRWVAAGKMTQAEADRELARMRAIADDYREPTLFDGAH